MIDFGNYPTNGTYEDILAFLARSEESRQRRQGIAIPIKSPLTRLFLEPVFNICGLALNWFVRACPPQAMLRFHDWLLKKLAHDISLPFEENAPGLLEARNLAENIRRNIGKQPALLCIMSHPPVDKEWLNLNLEMTRHALLGMASVRKAPCRPRVVVAVDSYGLDMLGLFDEAMYAGVMGSYHLGIDRLALRRRCLSRFLIRRASWSRMPWNMLRELSEGGEVAIVLAGGVPQTARMLYAVREFLLTLRRRRDCRRNPKETLEALKKISNDFAAFSTSGAVGNSLSRSAWRMMDAWIAARITGQWNFKDENRMPDAYSGSFSQGTQEAFLACVESLQCPRDAFESSLRSFREEFRRETPYRARFFRMVAARVVGRGAGQGRATSSRGTPVLLMPLTHRFEGTHSDKLRRVRLSWGKPVALPPLGDGGTQADEFARSFVESNFQ